MSNVFKEVSMITAKGQTRVPNPSGRPLVWITETGLPSMSTMNAAFRC